MVLAWSLTEVPRYSYYALGLLGLHSPPWLTWLRYSTFYILYPLGAGSEVLLALSTISEWQNGLYANWALEDWLKAAMVLIWIPGTFPRVLPLCTALIASPGLYVMYTHMIRTRRKVLGPQKAQRLGANPKDRAKAN
ncbi:protein-tyrosine phosphatase-like protein [Lanmaoa asiatica]|nr:protein-tyrosine phosphatase-like protein [Lanmaoa asiatica]